jgi:hypothetical protein
MSIRAQTPGTQNRQDELKSTATNS